MIFGPKQTRPDELLDVPRKIENSNRLVPNLALLKLTVRGSLAESSDGRVQAFFQSSEVCSDLEL